MHLPQYTYSCVEGIMCPHLMPDAYGSLDSVWPSLKLLRFVIMKMRNWRAGISADRTRRRHLA